MSDDKVTIDMLPIDYRNNQFKDNVDFFKMKIQFYIIFFYLMKFQDFVFF